jgi:chromosome segregation ATPase
MNDDRTEKLSGTQGSGSPQSDDRIDFIVAAVQSLAASMEIVKEDIQGIKEDIKELRSDLRDAVVRIEKLEQAAQQRALDTKPIWERALAEIASVRIELVEIKNDIKAIKAEQDEMKSDITAIKAELVEMKSDITAIKAELVEMKSDIAAIKTELVEMKSDIAAIKTELADTKNVMQDGFLLLAEKFEAINDDMMTLRANHRRLKRQVEGLPPRTP